MLNLLFSLHVSPRPLTTSEIVDDPEIGYLGKKSATRDSRCKAFRRDRETLAEFSLHVSPRPLTTSEIVDDPEIGYLGKKSATRDSRCKAFRRDRETLAEHGVHIREVLAQSAGGIAVNEESAWAIDRERTHAAQGVLSPSDAEEIVCAIDQVFELHADDPTLWPLQTARTKLCELAGRDPSSPGCANSPAETRRHPSGQMKAGLT